MDIAELTPKKSFPWQGTNLLSTKPYSTEVTSGDMPSLYTSITCAKGYIARQ